MSFFLENGPQSKEYCWVREGRNDWCRDARDFIESIWPSCAEFVDSDLQKDARNAFHQRWWELYLSHVLLASGVALVSRKNRNPAKQGPDLLAIVGGRRFWIEAVTVFSGMGPDAVTEGEEGVAHEVPDDPIKLRLQSALSRKLQKYHRYLARGWIKEKDGYIVALNAARVPYAMHERTVPRIVASVFPVGCEVVHLDRDALHAVDLTYQYQECVLKNNGQAIPATSFLNEAYKRLSGVLYSHADAYNRPTNTGRDFVLVHNPLADVRLSVGLLKRGREFQAELSDPRVLTIRPMVWGSAS
jgi:hypothetical protein